MRSFIYFLLGILLSCSMFPFTCHADWYLEGPSSYPTCTTAVYLNSLSTWRSFSTLPVDAADNYCTQEGFKLAYKRSSSSCGYDGVNFSYYWDYYTCTSTPPVTEPETCHNLVKDEDEIGINCGGPCDDECQTFCPDGQELILVGDFQTCSYKTDVNASGDCPDGWVKSIDGTYCSEVFTSTPPIEAFPGWDPASLVAPETEDNPFNVHDSSENTSYESSDSVDVSGDPVHTDIVLTSGTDSDGNEWTSEQTTETITHADGSKTVVTTTTSSKNGSGDSDSSSSISTLTQEFDANDKLISEQETKSEESADENAGNIVSEKPDADSINFQPFIEVRNKLSERFPISILTTLTNALNTWSTGGIHEVPTWEIEIWHHKFKVDPSCMNPVALFVRNLLHILVAVFFSLRIYKRWV